MPTITTENKSPIEILMQLRKDGIIESFERCFHNPNKFDIVFKTITNNTTFADPEKDPPPVAFTDGYTSTSEYFRRKSHSGKYLRGIIVGPSNGDYCYDIPLFWLFVGVVYALILLIIFIIKL